LEKGIFRASIDDTFQNRVVSLVGRFGSDRVCA